jgi:acetyltransferase
VRPSTAGFNETRLEQQLVDIAQRYGIRIVGPNVLGVIDTVASLNASFAAGCPATATSPSCPSPALCTSVLDFALG